MERKFTPDLPFSSHMEPRVPGEREIRHVTDPTANILLEQLDQEDSLGRYLRKKYLPNGLAYQPDKLVNQFHMERQLDKMFEVKIEAQLMGHRVPGQVAAAVLGAFTKDVVDSGGLGFFTAPIRAVQRSLDVISHAEGARLQLNQKFNEQSIEALFLGNRIMKAEMRDWLGWLIVEMARAFLAPNRVEWFAIFTEMTGVHQDISTNRAEMDNMIKTNRSRLEGAGERRTWDIAAPFVNYLTNGKTKPNPLSSAILAP